MQKITTQFCLYTYCMTRTKEKLRINRKTHLNMLYLMRDLGSGRVGGVRKIGRNGVASAQSL